MPPPDVIKTQGTVLNIGDGASPEVFTKVGNVTGATGIGSGSASEIEATDFDSTAIEVLMGLKDEGTVAISLNFKPTDAGQVLVEAARDSQTLTNYQIDVPTSPVWRFSFAAYALTFDKGAEPNDAWRATANLRISGAVTGAAV